MEVDNSYVNSEGSQSMEDPEEPSTPDDKFYIEGPCLEGDKDEETVKAIRYLLLSLLCPGWDIMPQLSSAPGVCIWPQDCAMSRERPVSSRTATTGLEGMEWHV